MTGQAGGKEEVFGSNGGCKRNLEKIHVVVSYNFMLVTGGVRH